MDQEHKDQNSESNPNVNSGEVFYTVKINDEPENQSEVDVSNAGTVIDQQGDVAGPSTSAEETKVDEDDGKDFKIFDNEFPEIDTHTGDTAGTFNVMRRLGFTPTEHYNLKIIFVGDYAVGKTAVIQQYLTKKFRDFYKVTIGVEFELRHFAYDQHTVITLKMWDIAGQERTRLVTRQFYQDANVIMLVCDKSRVNTFDDLTSEKGWIPMLQREVLQFDSTPVPIILLVNKSDLPSQGITKEKLNALCSEYKLAAWHFTSAKEDKNIEEAMKYAIEVALRGQKRATAHARIEEARFNKRAEQEMYLQLMRERRSKLKQCC